jgi:hypothetical protein
MRNMLIALAVPPLLAGACAENGASDGTLLVAERPDGVVGIIAQYQTDADVVGIVTRRIVTEVTELDGSRQELYIPAGASATDFQVEVTLYDLRRNIRLSWNGARTEVATSGAPAAELNQALALFTDATVALAHSSDQPIADAERLMFADLAQGVSSHLADPINDPIDSPSPVEPYDESAGCGGIAMPPTFSGNKVLGTGWIQCADEGDIEAEICMYSRELKGWWGSTKEFLNPFSFEDWSWHWPFENPLNNDDRQDTHMEKRGCATKAERHYAANEKIDLGPVDVLCGSKLGAGYEYESRVRMVSDEGGWFFDRTNWEDVGRPSQRIKHTCGE